MYWESLVCCVKCKRLIINISRFVCFTFHVTKKTIPWMRTNSSTLLFSGWMYVQIQWLNKTLLIMNKTQSTFLLCFDVLVLWWMMEEQEMIVSFWLKRNRWEMRKVWEHGSKPHREQTFISVLSNEIVCKHHLLRFVVVLLICFEWAGRKRRNKHLLLTIVQDWWKPVFLMNELSVAE